MSNISNLSSYLLYPASLGYRLAVGSRNTLYDWHVLRENQVPVPIVCVGNLTVGGTGKTPMVSWLTNYFSRQGKKVAILTRGYKRSSSQSSLVLLPDAGNTYKVSELGDEAAMLHARHPQASLVLDADRSRGARAVCSRWQPDIIIMDDGFQHRRLRRTVNIVMIDSQRLFGNGFLLPAGPLREPISALQRADLVVFNKFDAHHTYFAKKSCKVFDFISPARLFTASYQLKSLYNLRQPSRLLTVDQLQGKKMLAFAGIANPDYFFQQLENIGIKLQHTLPFADHMNYDRKSLQKISQTAASCQLTVTTAKDAVKITAFPETCRLLPELLVADIKLQIEPQNHFIELLESRLSLGYSIVPPIEAR
ncbi:MAG TPA: tetraacyldisaccharide 4'-kinase [Proteobacteria bacterium]|nr:tetraacyldisaccharide 4'-kinase [Pseudomonadota bacterium]